MSRASVLILLGVLTIITPFSGFPSAIRSLIAAALGACVLGIGLMFRTREAQGVAPRVETPVPPAPEMPLPSEPVSPHGVSPI